MAARRTGSSEQVQRVSPMDAVLPTLPRAGSPVQVSRAPSRDRSEGKSMLDRRPSLLGADERRSLVEEYVYKSAAPPWDPTAPRNGRGARTRGIQRDPELTGCTTQDRPRTYRRGCDFAHVTPPDPPWHDARVAPLLPRPHPRAPPRLHSADAGAPRERVGIPPARPTSCAQSGSGPRPPRARRWRPAARPRRRAPSVLIGRAASLTPY
jgi:hypothetical protein